MKKSDIDDILKDVREKEIFEFLTTEEKVDWEEEPKKRRRLYLREKKKMKRDAERWTSAIDSYKRYSCFSFADKRMPRKYYVENSFVCYCKENGEPVRLQADLLTNAGMIEEAISKYELTIEDQKTVNAFYKVAYTIGNFSLIWMNPGGDNGVDTCWDKLEHSGMYKFGELQKQPKGLEKRENNDNFNERKKENLFMILPLNENPREVIQKLYFQDYYDYYWKLRWTNQNVKKLKKELLLSFIKEITILIVQRSYRIIYNCTGNRLTQEEQSNIKAVLSEIGLNGAECIYSQKMNVERV